MKITNETTILELIGTSIIEDGVYTSLRNEDFKNVQDVLMRARDPFFFNSLKPEVRGFVTFLKEITTFYKQYEDGLITSDTATVLPASLIFTIRSIYQNEKKRFNAEYILSTILYDESDSFIYSFLYSLFVEPSKFLKEELIRKRISQDSLISKNADAEMERYNYAIVSIITKINDALSNFPDSIYYKRLVRMSIKAMNIKQDIINEAEDYANILNYHTTISENISTSNTSISDELQSEYDKLQREFSIRTRNVIKYNLPSYKDILPWVEGKEKDFNFRNCGKKSEIELRVFIESFSKLYFAYKESPSVKERKAEADAKLVETITFLLQNEFEKENNFDADVTNNLYTVYHKWTLLAEDIVKQTEQVLVRICEHSMKYALDSFDLVMQACSKIALSIKNIEDYKDSYAILVDTIAVFADQRSKNIRRLEHYKYITPDKELLLKQEFDKLLSRRSVQCQNIITNNKIGYMEFLAFRGNEYEFRNFRNVGRKCEEELKKLLDDFEHGYKLILNNDSKEARQQKYQNYFPFLDEKDIIFIDYYFSCYNHYPMFYVLCRYFETTAYKNAKIFASFCGLVNNALYDLDKIADYYNHTRERVRQIVAKRSFADPHFRMIMNPEWWESYDLKISGVVTLETSKYDKIRKEERLDISFYAYSILLTLLIDVYVLNVTESQKGISQTEIGEYINKGIPFNTYIFSSNYRGFKFFSAITEVGRLTRLRRDTTIKIPIRSYFATNPEYWSGEKTLEENQVDEFIEVFETILDDFFDDYIENHHLVLETNRINYAEILYGILKEHGESMRLQDIFDRYKQLYPNSKYNDAKQIKPYLFRDERIKNIGRSSMYTLAEWNEYTGSLFELAVDLVEATKTPIKIEELAKEMLVFRPSSTERSTQSIIYLCVNDGRLVQFYGDMVGIPKRTYGGDYILQPRNFDEWMTAFKEFTIKHGCFPIGTAKGFEGALYNWYYDARTYINLSSDEILKFHQMLKDFEKIPHTVTEKKFLDNCERYKGFVQQTGRMLDKSDEKSLYYWFIGNLKKYTSYEDNRRLYFKELINFLQDEIGGI